MYTLILTMLIYRGGTSIEHIPGFKTEQECLAIGNAWLTKQDAALRRIYSEFKSYSGIASINALCFKQ